MIHLGADGTSSSSFALCFPFWRVRDLRCWILGVAKWNGRDQAMIDGVWIVLLFASLVSCGMGTANDTG